MERNEMARKINDLCNEVLETVDEYRSFVEDLPIETCRQALDMAISDQIDDLEVLEAYKNDMYDMAENAFDMQEKMVECRSKVNRLKELYPDGFELYEEVSGLLDEFSYFAGEVNENCGELASYLEPDSEEIIDDAVVLYERAIDIMEHTSSCISMEKMEELEGNIYELKNMAQTIA